MFPMRFLIIGLLFTVSSFAAPPSASAARAGLDPALLARIPARLHELVQKGELPGIVTLVARHGVIAELDAEGYRDIDARDPMKTDSIFQIMSMTKPFTCTGIMMLMEEGRLALTDPVEKFLPEFRGQLVALPHGPGGGPRLTAPTRPIMIRDLMTHTSGMTSDVPESVKGLDEKMNHSLAEAVAAFAKLPLAFEPGTSWHYSNAGIATLGRIIEVVSGEPYQQFIEERLLKPLGMKNTFYFPPPDKTGRISLVYRHENGKLTVSGADILGGDPRMFRKGAIYPAPEFGLYSTASNLFTFYQMMLDGGTYRGHRYLSRASIDVMRAVHTGDIPHAGWMDGTGYGLGWEVVKDPMGTLNLNSIGTYGHGGAFGTQGWIDPKRDLIRVMLVQVSDGSGDNARNLFFGMSGSAIADAR